jgi:RHS repeat-associated protein
VRDPTASADPWTDPAGTRLVGDPVDVVTGRVTERTQCFRLIGPLFLQWDRHYDSAFNRSVRGFGWGHAPSYDHRLIFDANGLRLEEPIGRHTGFPPLLSDSEAHTARGMTLQRMSLLSYRLTRPGSPALDFAFAHPERPARIVRASRGNAAIQFHYTREGQLFGIVHSTGLRITAKEDNAHRLLSLAGAWDGGGKERAILTCEYDGDGNLIVLTDAYGWRSTFDYDGANRLVRRTDRRGYSWLYEYDAEGRCVRSAGEDGAFGVALRFLPSEYRTEVNRSDGGQWVYHYDVQGWITHIVGPYGDTRRFVKGENGRTSGEVDALGHQLNYVFDPGGALVGKRFASGRVIPMQAGKEIADPPPYRVADRPLQYLYGDLLVRLLPVPQELAAVPGELRRALWPEPEPLPASPDVPPFGNLPWYPEPVAGREFTPFGHLICQTLPGGAQRRWTYDENDAMADYTDGDGAVRRQQRRGCDPVSAIIDPLGGAARFRWTTEDLLSAVTDPGGTVSEFARDQEGRLIGVRRAGELHETYRRDSAGNLVEKRDAAGAVLVSVTPTEDRLVSERRLASGAVQRFSYDAAGRFISASVDASEVRFAYDERGRPILDMRDGEGVAHDFAAGPGRETTMVLDRFVITREIAGARLRIRLPGGAFVRVDRLGPRTVQKISSNGTTELCRFDVMGRLVASAVASARNNARYWLRRWSYSAEGDLLEAEDSRNGTIRYRYDAAHRLVAAARANGESKSYAHDAAGNLVLQPGLAGVELFGNRLAAANGERFVYDVRQHIGERHGSGGTIAYRYDSRDMLVAVERGERAWRAEYDALGRRVRTLEGEAEHRFFWDTDRLAAEIFPSGLLRLYVYADPLALTPLAFIDYTQRDADPEAGAVRFVFTDQRGAPVLVEDGAGNVVWQARLAPYGTAEITSAGGLTLNLRFPGHYFDAATGLHYNRFRYYDPVLGRYLQSDPLGIGGGLNVYAYPADPLVQVDTRGLNGDGNNCPGETKQNQQQIPGDAQQDDKSAPPPPEQGSVADANFAQSKIKADESFSKEGAAKYSELAGRPINNVDDLAAAIKDGSIKPSQLPVDFVTNPDGNKLILNTRTSVALDRADVPKSDWYGQDKTGAPVPGAPEGTTFNDLANDQLKRNKLPPSGSPDIPKGRR